MARKATKSKSKSKKLNPEALIQLKAFKTSSEVETFYSYVYENGLRREASILLETVLKATKKKKKSKTLH